jgi:class 3 adenylate cyclase/tetratricopeptide (TPR) repeat protein
MLLRRKPPTGDGGVSTITEWLGSLGLSEYEQRFAENGIGIDVLQHLTDQDLKDIGVLLGHRRKMLAAIAQLSIAGSTPPHPVSTTEPKPQDVAERRQLTVMFCDLVGSTALSIRLDPEDLRAIIGTYHRCCADVISKAGGFVAKYMGDGILAYFGYPQAHEEDAERAVRAGLALIEAVPKLDGHGGTALQVRIGIATGLVVVGDLLGEGAAQEQAVVGDTPNLAARLQALAEPGAVVISASTRRLTGGLFDYRDLGTVALKGFAENVQAWQVLGLGSAEGRFEALRTANTPLVGRDEEIELLIRRWEQAKAGDGQVVLTCGEPGIGKSRIVQTILERIAAEPHTRMRFFCSPHHQDSAFYPSIAQLERAAGFRREDTDAERLSKLEAVLAQGTNDLREVVPLLADLLSIPTGDRYPPLTLTPQKRKEKTLQAMIAQVEGLAGRQPVLMVFEDVHWSDPTTREVLDLLVDRVASLRVLVVLTFRPEFKPPWIGRPHVTMLTLSRLSPRRRGEMISHLTGGKVLPKEIADQIIERTDGVPLFIEELTKTVVESGIVTEAGDRYDVAGPVPSLAIPTSLQASLLARLDRLAPTREVAQIGAALGRSFSHELISAVAQMAQIRLDDALEQLVHAELMFRRGTPPNAEYKFKHALVQDAAYGTLLRSRRQQLHGRITTTLETQFPEMVAAQPALVAQHSAEAGLSEKAIAYWLKAGEQAIARSAMTEAVAQFQKGLDLLTSMLDDPARQQQELDLRIAFGRALTATSGWASPAVAETNARARLLAERLDRPDSLFPLLYGQCTFHNVRGEQKLVLAHAQQMEEIGRARNNAAMLLMGRSLCGLSYFLSGEFVTSRAFMEQCYAMNNPADRAANRAACATVTAEDPHVVILTYLALSLGYLGYVDAARCRAREALSEASKLGHVFSLAWAQLHAFWLECAVGSPCEIRRHAEQTVSLAIEHGFPFFLAWGLIYSGWSMSSREASEEGYTLIARGLSMHRATGAVAFTAFALTLLAEACNRLGRTTEGLNYLTEAEKIIETANDRFHEAELHRVRGDLLNASTDHATAEQSYRQALAVAQRQIAKVFELRAATSLARLWRDQGKRAEAHDLLAPVYGWFTEGFDTPVLMEAKALLDELALERPSFQSALGG